ncbi:MAG: hypothetical protein AB7G11_00965 [Phycisphaerales bacterium]
MLVLNPPLVKFDTLVWTDVTLVMVDRHGDKVVLERGDLGPHVIFADVPERRIAIRVTREMLRDDVGSPKPGQQGDLVFYTAPGAADGLRRRVRATCVITGVTHEVGRLRGALQSILLVAISSDGAADPIAIEDASDGVV